MKVRVVDDAALASPDPRNIRVYLRTRGWRPAMRGNQQIWTLTRADGEYEVLAPSPDFADFQQQVAMLLYTLSVVEERSEMDVLRDLFSTSFDLQHIHRQQSGPPGTLVIGEAARTYGAARNLIEAAAASLAAPTAAADRKQAQAQPDRAKSLLRSVLTGPPEVGSYVVSVWVPVPPRRNVEDDAVLLDDQGEPFARAVTRRLNRAVVAARSAAAEVRNGGSTEAFLRERSSGVTADLCGALFQLAGRRPAPLELRFTWALDRPAVGVSNLERFDAGEIEVLGLAVDVLRERQAQVELRGRVERLWQRRRGSGGDITVEGQLRGYEREGIVKVRVALAKAEYERALLAQREGNDVVITGTLEDRPSGRWLTRVTDFAVVAI